MRSPRVGVPRGTLANCTPGHHGCNSPMTTPRTLHMVSLGCPKNRVDSEVMLGVASRRGYRIVDDPARAHVIVINTCGFVQDAKRESIGAIFELAEHKKTGVCRTLVVTGCLTQRYHDELAAQIPEIDYLLGSGDVLKLGEVLDGRARRMSVGNAPGYLVRSTDPRVVSTGAVSAYVKIAEGCDRKCGFCTIPQLRGRYRSRKPSDIVREVKRLTDQGVIEINVVSQDTVAYGRDLDRAGRSLLADLVLKIASLPDVRWTRLMYLYPDPLDDRLVDLLANHPRVLAYVDMPMQHASDTMLRRMRRGHSHARLRRIIERLRDRIPELTMRTAMIVGFPGETDDDFRELCEFVSWARFDRLGVFRYSDEQDAASYALKPKIPARVSYGRARRLMALQRTIARAINRGMIGREIEVLVEGSSEEHGWVMVGRHGGQAPEIDGQVYFTNSDVRAGELWRARVVDAADHDVVVEVCGDRPMVDSPTQPKASPRRLRVVR